jgi:hypothetical protein
MNVILKDFLLLGRFGDLEPNMHIDEVKEMLGEPQDIAYSRKKYPHILKYQSLERVWK